MDNLEITVISPLMMEVGVNPGLKGYRYIKEALKLVYDEPEYLDSVTKKLYPTVAAICNSTPSRVERAMRHAIETTFNNTDPDVIHQYFGNVMSICSGRVTNIAFIAVMNELVHRRVYTIEQKEKEAV